MIDQELRYNPNYIPGPYGSGQATDFAAVLIHNMSVFVPEDTTSELENYWTITKLSIRRLPFKDGKPAEETKKFFKNFLDIVKNRNDDKRWFIVEPKNNSEQCYKQCFSELIPCQELCYKLSYAWHYCPGAETAELSIVVTVRLIRAHEIIYSMPRLVKKLEKEFGGLIEGDEIIARKAFVGIVRKGIPLVWFRMNQLLPLSLNSFHIIASAIASLSKRKAFRPTKYGRVLIISEPITPLGEKYIPAEDKDTR